MRVIRAKMYDQEEELAALTERVNADATYYEKELAIERRKFYLVQLEWANRLLQSQKLLPISGVVANVEEDVSQSERFIKGKDVDPTDQLTNDQFTYFSDIKESFWSDGKDLGRSEAEIQLEWQHKLPSVIENVTREVNSGPSSASG